MSLSELNAQRLPRTRWLIVWFVACSTVASLGGGLLLYVVGVFGCASRAARRPIEALQLVFLSLATAVSAIPYDYHNHWGGAAPDPYWYWGISIVLPAAAAYVGLNFWRSRHKRWNCTRPLPLAGRAFLLATLAAAAYGLGRGNGVGIILRQGSGLAFLFFFIVLGRGLAPKPNRLLGIFREVRCILVAYGSVYLAHYTYLNVKSVQDLGTGVFLREPTPPLFFCGLFAALSLGEWIFRSEGDRWAFDRGFWASTSVLALAAVFSGSRASVACMIFTVTFFIIVKFARHPVRLLALLAILALLFAWSNPESAISSVVQTHPFLQHVAERFMVQPEGDSSFLQRSSQLLATWQAFTAAPTLGRGIGASLVWFNPVSLSWVETAFVDNGFGYLLLKMGLVGTLTFFWFLVFLFKRTWSIWAGTRLGVFLAVLGSLVYYTAYLPFEPAFFEFLFCFWIAALIGCLLRVRADRAVVATVPSTVPQPS